MVPDSRAYAIAIMLVLVMVKVMIAPQPFHPFESRVPGMYGVVRSRVHKIDQYRPGIEHKKILPQYMLRQSKTDGSEYEEGHRWHEKTLFIPWRMMMFSVNGIRYHFSNRMLTYPMK